MHKLSVSNIGWSAEQDEQMYKIMKDYGYSGLEIAPTRIFPETPYDRKEDVRAWSGGLKKKYGFVISSMQSVWYGRQEKLFGSDEERRILTDYTKKAVDFAEAAGCKNLVFGCPRNRNLPEGADAKAAIPFFKEIGDYAAEHGAVIGMEANPPVYQTNYINDTTSALEIVQAVDSAGFKLNLDTGTMIQNKESVQELAGKVQLIHHVHISEPGLGPVKDRALHTELKKLLEREGYQGFISIEMGRTEDIQILDDRMDYVRSIFG